MSRISTCPRTGENSILESRGFLGYDEGYSLLETNSAQTPLKNPENGPKLPQKGSLVFQSSIFRCDLLVSGRVVYSCGCILVALVKVEDGKGYSKNQHNKYEHIGIVGRLHTGKSKLKKHTHTHTDTK